MQIRIYLDEDPSSRSLARGLRFRGIDVLTAVEAGQLKSSDAAQLEFATQEQRTIFACNVADFCRLLSDCARAARSHVGIILVAQSRFPIGEQLRLVLKLAAAITAEEMRGRIEFLSNWS